MTRPHFNPRIAALAPPAIPTVLSWKDGYRGERGAMIDLSQAVPGYRPHALLLDALGRAAGSGTYTGYGNIEGEDSLRDAFATETSRLYDTLVTPDNIHITSGANQAFVAAAMAVAGVGDRIAMTVPFYFNQEATLAMLGIGLDLIPCDASDAFLPALADIEAALARGVKAIVLVSPNNPTGTIYPAPLLAAIHAAVRKAGAWLILDETYRDFLPLGEGRPHDLLGSPDWDENLVLLYSFSKAWCIPGHRLGAIIAGRPMVEHIARIMDNLQICAPRPAQAALAEAMPQLQDWKQANRAEIARRAEALHAVMARLPAWSVAAAGAYFAFVKHPFPGVSAPAIAERMAKTYGVLCLPGSYFGQGLDGYLRFAFANADAETIGRLEERLAGFALA